MNKIKLIKNTWWQKIIFAILLFFPLANWIFFIIYGYFLISSIPGKPDAVWFYILAYLHWGILFVGSLIWILMIGEWFCIGFKKDIIDEFINNQEVD
jgi:hypothetical protein